MGIPMLSCLLQHIALHGGQHLAYLLCQLRQGNYDLLAGIATDNHSLICLDILRSNLDTYRDTLHLLLRELPARALVRIVYLHLKACLQQGGLQLVSLIQNTFLMLGNGDNHHLGRRDPRRQNQSAVIAVNHDDSSNQTGSHTPGCLMYILQGVVFCCILNVKCLCEAIAEVVAGTGLQRLAVMHQRLDGIGCLRACELLLIGLASTDNRHSQNLLAEIRIQVQHLLGTCLCLLCGRMGGMALLPQELTGTQERTGGLLPTHNGAPLVIYLRKITVGLDLLCVKITEQGLGSRTDTHALLQRLQSAMGHPCYLRRKALYMILLLLKQALRNQHGQIYVLNT